MLAWRQDVSSPYRIQYNKKPWYLLIFGQVMGLQFAQV